MAVCCDFWTVGILLPWSVRTTVGGLNPVAARAALVRWQLPIIVIQLYFNRLSQFEKQNRNPTQYNPDKFGFGGRNGGLHINHFTRQSIDQST